MLHTFFKNKENKEKSIALNQYNFILKKSKDLLNDYDYFFEKNYKSSFEIVSLFLIMLMNINLKLNKHNLANKINENLITLFISDLDESLRQKGIGDMSIGKYVKSYVKKFYFRLSKFPKNYDKTINDSLVNYLNITNFVKKNEIYNFSIKLNEIYMEIFQSFK